MKYSLVCFELDATILCSSPCDSDIQLPTLPCRDEDCTLLDCTRNLSSEKAGYVPKFDLFS